MNAQQLKEPKTSNKIDLLHMTDFLDHKVPYYIQKNNPKRTAILPTKDTCNQLKSIFESNTISLRILIAVRLGEPHIK